VAKEKEKQAETHKIYQGIQEARHEAYEENIKQLEESMRDDGLVMSPEEEAEANAIYQSMQEIYNVGQVLKEEIQEKTKEALENAPQDIRESTQQTADNLCSTMEELQEAEKECGALTESWNEYKENHHEPIKENLANLKENIENNAEPKAVQESAQKVNEKMNDAASFLLGEKINAEIAIIQQALANIQQLAAGANLQEAEPCIAAGKEAVEQWVKIEKDEAKKADTHYLKDISDEVSKTWKAIKGVPSEIKTAIKNKSYVIADSVLRKTANVFLNLSQYFKTKGENTLKKSPLYKPKKQQEAKQEENKENEKKQLKVKRKIKKKGFSR
jgi:hypothetical protein